MHDRIRLSAVLLLVGVIVCLGLHACQDKIPTKPVTTDKTYSVYLYNETDSVFYEYVPADGMVVDSFSVPYPAWLYSLSADGSMMFFRSGDNTVVVDRATLTEQRVLPDTRVIDASPDGQWLAVGDPYLKLVNPSTWETLYTDTTIEPVRGVFTQSSSHLYVLVGWSVYRLDLSGGLGGPPVYVTSTRSLHTIAATPSGDKLGCLVSSGNCRTVFAVYDTERDTIVHKTTFNPGRCRMAASPNGKYLFVSNPGDYISYECDPPEYGIWVFDLEANAFTDFISSIGEYGPEKTLDTMVWIRGLTVTPDGQWVIGTSDRNRFIVINATTLEPAAFECFGSDMVYPIIKYPAAQAGR
jgi:hypothetical protein